MILKVYYEISCRTDPKKSVTPNWELNEGMEIQREVFRRPRDALLSLAAIFLKMAIPRMKDLSKVVAEHGKMPDLLDQKAHMVLYRQKPVNFMFYKIYSFIFL